MLPIMNGKPGLRRTREMIAKLEAEVEALRASLARWPTAETTHPYVYTGPRFSAVVGGRELEPGDVAELTENQAKSWANRFKEAAEERASAGYARALDRTECQLHIGFVQGRAD